MMRSLLCLLFAAPAMASSLRGAVPAERSLQVSSPDLEADQLAWIVNFVMMPTTDTEILNPDYGAFETAVLDWMVDEVIPETLVSFPDYTLDTTSNELESDSGCIAEMMEGQYNAFTGMRRNSVRFICEFTTVDAPNTGLFVSEARTQSLSLMTELEGAIEGSGGPWADLASVTTTDPSFLDWAPTLGSGSRQDLFENGYVLPYVITWSFTTPPTFANETDFNVTRSATKQWVESHWDALYPMGVGATFARRTIDVAIMYSTFSPRVKYYQQSVVLSVDILVGANNITDVPTMREYITTMQIVGRVSNFTDILEEMVPESILLNSTRTGFAMTPTFEVMTLEDNRVRGEPPLPGDLTAAASTFQVIL